MLKGSGDLAKGEALRLVVVRFGVLSDDPTESEPEDDEGVNGGLDGMDNGLDVRLLSSCDDKPAADGVVGVFGVFYKVKTKSQVVNGMKVN